MTEVKTRNDQNADRNGLALIAIALVFGAFAVTADLLWMAPHASSQPVVSTEPGTGAPSATETPYYFPSQFTLQANETDEPATPAPTF